jgi:hypothetical protein
MKVEFHKLHRQLVLILFLPLILIALTEVGYYVGRDWIANILMQIANVVPLYVSLVGLVLLRMSVTGITLVGSRSNSGQPKTLVRKIYKWLGLIYLFPVAVKVSTGVAYELGSMLFGMSSEQTENFLRAYQAAYLVATLIVFYFFILGLYAIAPLIAQIKITSWPKIRIPRWPVWQSSVARPLSQNRRQQNNIQNTFDESEVTSHTILKAIPDSMLHICQDGKCLNYIPAKGENSFMLDGDIVGKHLNDFLPPKIAHQLIKYARLALKTGLTQAYKFSISANDARRGYEARLSAIGETEVLVMIRDSADFQQATIKHKPLKSRKK